MPKTSTAPLFNSEFLLLLALSCSQDQNGLSVEEAIFLLRQDHSFQLTLSRARAALKTLERRGAIQSKGKRVPPNRKAEAEHYALSAMGREELRSMLRTISALRQRTMHIISSD